MAVPSVHTNVYNGSPFCTLMSVMAVPSVHTVMTVHSVHTNACNGSLF